LTYYAGGFGGNGSGPGPLYGVSFSAGLAADSTPIIFGPSALVTAPSVTMNLDSPWSQLLSFYFVGKGDVAFYSGPNATGNLLQSYTLVYPPFFPFAEGPGPFESVVFTPSSGSTLRLDSISLGSFSLIPEPSVAILIPIGMLLIAGLGSFAFDVSGIASSVVVPVFASAEGVHL